jgi:hypothetical protein
LDEPLDGISPLVTPVKTPPTTSSRTPAGSPWAGTSATDRTPGKFRGKTESEITEMSEEDQVEYLTHVSRREMFAISSHKAAIQLTRQR